MASYRSQVVSSRLIHSGGFPAATATGTNVIFRALPGTVTVNPCLGLMPSTGGVAHAVEIEMSTTTMVKAVRIALMLVVGLQAVGCTAVPEASFRRFEFSRIRMGADATITIWSTQPEANVEAAADAAFERIAGIEEATSDWLTHGRIAELRDAVPGKPVRLRGDVLLAMEASAPLVKLTDGAFDPASGRMTALWRKARLDGTPPDQAAVTPSGGGQWLGAAAL